MPNAQGTDAKTQLRMMEPFSINRVHFKNRIVRSSLGGQLASADGAVTNAFRNFERHFAKSGVSALVSATISVNEKRYSPLYYPDIAKDRFVGPLKSAIASAIHDTNCRYIVQIGDPGYHTQTSLFSQPEDGKAPSPLFDLLYGYRDSATMISKDEIKIIVESYCKAARRVADSGADGLEITASKGYLIHQFLNPGINRRKDEYGGEKENRFLMLREIIRGVRDILGKNFLLGVRISARDHNNLPRNFRWPPVFPWRHYTMGNDLPETLYFATELEALGVDYLHISNGFGFINPKENPGDFPIPEARRLFNATRHLSRKAAFRATLANLLPDFALKAVFGKGWGKQNIGENADLAAMFKKKVQIPIIANGGFQSRTLIEKTLKSEACDMVSMARPLLANPDLLTVFKTGEAPKAPCSFCNRCCVLTAVGPVGCYDPGRFGGDVEKMEQAILKLHSDPDIEGE